MDNKCYWCESKESLRQFGVLYCATCYEDLMNRKMTNELKRTDFYPQIDKITEKIYLGNHDGAREREKLKELGVTNILICGFFLWQYHKDEFIYGELDLKDDLTQDIYKYFIEAIQFIESSIGNIYIHCQKGISRSSSIVIAYLMWKNQWSYKEARSFVKARRDIVNPNDNFEKQLISFETYLLNNNFKLV
jgi:dual specificity phosphatase 12